MKKYVQITAGRGPVECARVVALVAREMLKEFPALSLTDCEAHNSRADCYMSMTLTADDIPQHFIREWEGTVMWVATKNPYRPNHKRKNWFVGVRFFDETELPKMSETDISYETCRSGGKGGQNVNKVETTVRAIHIPSGLTVKCSDERSQLQNKVLARERLLLKLLERRNEAQAKMRSAKWAEHDALERGNPVKRFRGEL